MRILTYALFALLVGNVAAAEWDIDIVEGTVNGKKLGTLTIDAVTDTFGRPSDSWTTPPMQIIGTLGQRVLVYADSGVKFMFNDDGAVLVEIFLVNARDGSGSFTQHYTRYNGKLNKGVSGDWKLKKFVESFKEFELAKQDDLAACMKGGKTWLQIDLDTTTGFMSTITVSSGGRISDFCNPRRVQ